MRTVSRAILGYPLPLLLSLAAIILGVGPGWRSFWTLELGRYDPTVAVLTATLIALIWAGFFSYRAVSLAADREAAERTRVRHEREFLLEALAEELTLLNRQLGMLKKAPSLARFEFLDHPQLRHCLSRTDLFPPSIAASMTALAGALRPLPSILRAFDSRSADVEFAENVRRIIEHADRIGAGLAAALVRELESGDGELAGLLTRTTAITTVKRESQSDQGGTQHEHGAVAT